MLTPTPPWAWRVERQAGASKLLRHSGRQWSCYPTSVDAHVNLGISLADKYDLHGALREFTRATELNTKSPSAHYYKARLLHDIGEREQAKAEAEVAHGLAPEDPPLLYLLGLVERETGNLNASTQAFEKLVFLQPKNGAAQFLLGQTLLRQGKQEAAIAHWKAAVGADPENIEALDNLGRVLSKLGDPEAETYLKRLREVEDRHQPSDRAESLNSFALEAARMISDWPRAVEQLKEALDSCGTCTQLPILHRNLGLIYARIGDIENAVRELNVALRLNPKDSDSSRAIDILEALRKEKSRPDEVRR